MTIFWIATDLYLNFGLIFCSNHNGLMCLAIPSTRVWTSLHVRLGDKLATCSCKKKKKKKKKKQPKHQLPLTRVFLRIIPFSYIIILYPQRASMAEGQKPPPSFLSFPPNDIDNYIKQPTHYFRYFFSTAYSLLLLPIKNIQGVWFSRW